MNVFRVCVWFQFLCCVRGFGEPAAVPFEDRDGQRFWIEKGLPKHIHQQAAKLRDEGALVPLADITAKLRERTTTDAVRAAVKEPTKEPGAAELVRSISEACVVVMTLDKDGKDAYGTGFAIAPGIIVTNWHVACPDKEFSDIVVMDRNGTVFPVTEGLAGLRVARFDIGCASALKSRSTALAENNG